MVQPKSLPCYSFSLATFTSPPEVSSHDEAEDEEVSRADCGTHDAPDPPAPSNTIPAMCITIALVCVSKLVVDVMADPNKSFGTVLFSPWLWAALSICLGFNLHSTASVSENAIEDWAHTPTPTRRPPTNSRQLSPPISPTRDNDSLFAADPTSAPKSVTQIERCPIPKVPKQVTESPPVARRHARKALSPIQPTGQDLQALRKGLQSMTVKQLKKELSNSGLPMSGLKKDLVDRLVTHSTGCAAVSPPQRARAVRKPAAERTQGKPTAERTQGKPTAERTQGQTQYTRHKMLGKGRFAEVYHVSTSEGDHFAMKILSAGSKGTLEKFHRECEVHRAAAYHNIAPAIVDSFVSNKKGHIVMEMMDGPSFAELAAEPDKHRAKAELALHKMQQLQQIVWTVNSQQQPELDPRALKSLSGKVLREHDKSVQKIGVSHGDLNKLDNIMWDNHSAQPYLIDFGLACWLEDRVDNDLKLHSRAVGTRDVDKSLTKWIGYDCNHLRAKFNL